MKALIKGSLAFMLLCIFSSCTKDNSDLPADGSSIKHGLSSASTEITPSLIVTFDHAPATMNQPVTVTGTFNTASGVPVPECGTLQLFQKLADGWVAVSPVVTVTGTVKSVNWSFVPAINGTDVYEFSVNYVRTGCERFISQASNSYFLSVGQACTGLTLTGSVSGSPCLDAPGMYDFTVNYTVSACARNYNKLKLQGSIMAASGVAQATSGYQLATGSGPYSISVLTWEETSAFPGNSKTFTATFRKAYSGSGTISITGSWSVKTFWDGVETGVSLFPPVSFNK